MTASQKLSHLLQLADQGPALRTALAEEVAELLADWPIDYPESMRAVCESLLAKAAGDIDQGTRARLRVQLYSEPELAHRVLPRACVGQRLVETARRGALAAALADNLDVDARVAADILADRSGASLAMACKGAGLDRAVFSALAVLAGAHNDRAQAFAVLDAFEAVSISEATRTLRGWRENIVQAKDIAAA